MVRATGAEDTAADFQRPTRVADRFDVSSLRSHYILSRAGSNAPEAWPRASLEGWNLAVAPDLPIVRLDDVAGSQFGWVIGHPVDLVAGRLVSEPIRLRCDLARSDVAVALDEELHRLGGRWVAIVLRPYPMVFPDGYGALPVLAASRTESVTSSPFLLNREDCVDSQFVDFFRVFENGSTFVLGTTPLDGVDLVPPNHVVDLRTFSVRRCWPRHRLDLLSLDDAIDRVGSSFEGTIAAALALGPAHVGLTAGGDTRMIAACSRNYIDDVDFFTVPFPDASGATDARWAPRVAARFGLRHRNLEWKPPTPEDVRLFMYRTGCITGERRGRQAIPTYAQLGGSGVYVSGVNGCAIRGADWGPRHHHDRPIPPDKLPAVLGVRPHPELIRRIEEWSDTLPEMHTLDMLTLLFLEMHDAAWGGALTGAYTDAAMTTLYPYASRTVIDAIMRTPWDDRRADRLRHGVIGARWPELLDLPLNRMTTTHVVERRARRFGDLSRAAFRKGVAALREVTMRNDAAA